MSRRGSFNIHAVIFGLAAVFVVTGVARTILTGGLSASNKVQITFWNGFTGPDGIVMLGIIDEFNRDNPDVQVTMQRIPWGTYYNKLTVAGSDGRGPAVFIIHCDGLLRYRRAGFMEDASPIFSGQDAVPKNDFEPYVFDQVKYRGKLLGCPLDIHPYGMFTNADMLKRAGIVDSVGNPRPPRTRNEFILAMKAMMKGTGSGTDRVWGYALTDWSANFRSLIPQFGGRYLDEKGNAVLNSPENVAAMTFIAGLAKDHLVPPPTNGLGWLGFRQQKVGMVWDGVFMLGDLKRINAFKYLGSPIPTIGSHPGTAANSHVMCIRTGLSPGQRGAAVRFIKYVSAHSIEWANAGQVPARLSARRDPRFADMQVQRAFAEQVPHIMYVPRSPVIVEIMNAINLAVDQGVRQLKTPEEALNRANKLAQAVIDRDRQDHPEDQP